MAPLRAHASASSRSAHSSIQKPQRCAGRIMRFSTMPESAPKIRVLVADDELLARRGVRQLLARQDDMVVVGESRNGPETLRALDALAPDQLFLDVQMPEMDGFEVLLC